MNRWLSFVLLFLYFTSGVSFAYCVSQQKINSDLSKKDIKIAVASTAKIEQKVDSFELKYQQLNNLVAEHNRIVKNYQADADLVLDKANLMVSLWLSIGTGFITIVIGLSIWNNYKQEHSYKESVEKIKAEIEETQKKQKASNHINKIGSIMTCLNNLPDPLLSEANADRRNYVNGHLTMMCDEFSDLVKLVKDDVIIVSDEDMKYLKLVLSSLKVSILRTQCVYSNVMSSLAFYTFSTELTKAEREIQSSNVKEKLDTVRDKFVKLREELSDNY